MKALLLTMGLGSPALMLGLGLVIASSARGETVRSETVSLAPVALSQGAAATIRLSDIDDVPVRIATARVTDAHGKVIGAVQKVELRNGRPTRLDIAVLGSANPISLDAAEVRYDTASNVVATGETAAQLMARAAI